MGTYKHIDDVVVRAVFEPGNARRVFRYRLDVSRRRVGDPARTVCAIMQNPSVADEKVADRSVKRLERIVFECPPAGFDRTDRLVVVNQFARIQTNDFDGTSMDIGLGNDAHIGRAIKESDEIIIAWGAANRYVARQIQIIAMIASLGMACVWLTPKHPSRMTNADELRPLNIQMGDLRGQ